MKNFRPDQFCRFQLQITLFDIMSCKLEMQVYNEQQLIGTDNLLGMQVRRSELDGGKRLSFTHEIAEDKRSIVIQGNLAEAIQALYTLQRISIQLRDEILDYLTHAIISHIRQVRTAVPGELWQRFAPGIVYAVNGPLSPEPSEVS